MDIGFKQVSRVADTSCVFAVGNASRVLGVFLAHSVGILSIGVQHILYHVVCSAFLVGACGVFAALHKRLSLLVHGQVARFLAFHCEWSVPSLSSLLAETEGVTIMALVLTGIMLGMRVVGGEVEDGPRKGQKWNFLSMEVTDTRFGKVYSCQLREDDPQYTDIVKDGKVAQDYTDHKVKMVVKGQTAGEREIEDKGTGQKRIVLQIRSQVTNIRDMGLPQDEE